MFQGKRIGAVLLMGGQGERFKDATPKQFHLIGDKPIYRHTLEIFLDSQFFDEIVLVCHAGWIERVKNEAPPYVRIVAGGETRQSSSWRGLQGFSTPPDIVSIHDAVRPFVTKEIIQANLEAALAYGAVDTCIPSTDTLVYAPDGKRISAVPIRAHYLRGQTPQTFIFDWIVDAHQKALAKGQSSSTDDCGLVLEAGYDVHIVVGSDGNIKITSALDLTHANLLKSVSFV